MHLTSKPSIEELKEDYIQLEKKDTPHLNQSSKHGNVVIAHGGNPKSKNGYAIFGFGISPDLYPWC
jgi:hypothetical protein